MGLASGGQGLHGTRLVTERGPFMSTIGSPKVPLGWCSAIVTRHHESIATIELILSRSDD